MKTITNLLNALKILSVHGRVTARETASCDRIVVYVDGDRFGIWDAEKNTFVDWYKGKENEVHTRRTK